MNTAEQIIHKVAGLRPEEQSKVLDFVELLKEREKLKEANDFQKASLKAAMRGLEDEEDIYTEIDITEKLG